MCVQSNKGLGIKIIEVINGSHPEFLLCFCPQSNFHQFLIYPSSSEQTMAVDALTSCLPPPPPRHPLFGTINTKLRTLLCNLPPPIVFEKSFHVSVQRSTSCFGLSRALIVYWVFLLQCGWLYCLCVTHSVHTLECAQLNPLKGTARVKGACTLYLENIYAFFTKFCWFVCIETKEKSLFPGTFTNM